MFWVAYEHTDQENLRYAWLRAVEWINWPTFVSQPVIPVLLYYFDWWWVVLSVVFVGHIWKIVVSRHFIWFWVADFVPFFRNVGFVTCPLMAYLIWKQGDYVAAVLALFWPIWISVIEIIFTPLLMMFGMRERDLWIGPVQRRFMKALGYTRRENDET